jgi:hypothetical protein
MQLLLEHSQKSKVFSLCGQNMSFWARNRRSLTGTTRSVVLVEGNPRQERDRAMKMAIGLSVVIFLLGFVGSRSLGFVGSGQALAGIPLALLAFPIGWIVIYHQIRETIKVGDILIGRHFACRSIITLLEKKQQISDVAQKFTQFLETLKNWGGREVVEMAPDRPPIARFVERPRAAE